MKSFLIAIKRTIQDIAARLDGNTYVVAIWNGVNWQVCCPINSKRGIDNRQLALATRNLISANRDIAPSNIAVFTTKIAERYGMYQ